MLALKGLERAVQPPHFINGKNEVQLPREGDSCLL